MQTLPQTSAKSAISFTLPQKGLVLVLVPLFFQLAFLLLLTILLRQAEFEAAREAHAKELSVHCDYLVSLVDSYSNVVLNVAETNNTVNLKLADEMIANINKDLPDLKRMTQGNPRQERIYDRLQSVCRFLSQVNEQIKITPLTDKQKWQLLITETWKTGPLVRTELQRMFADETRFESGVNKANSLWREQLKTITMAATAIDILLALLLAAFFSMQIVSRLKILTENSLRLGMDAPLLPLVKGSDEISNLDRVFHNMADTLAEARRRERAMVENTVDAICSIDADGVFQNVNTATQKLWNYSREELLTRHYKTIVQADDQRQTALALGEIQQSRTDAIFENQIVRKDGSLMPSRWSVSWSETEKAFFCIVQDVTEQKRLEELKRDFMAMVTHELRTPLSSLGAGLLMLSRGSGGELNEKGQRLIGAGQRSTDRLIRLVNDLLDAEKLEAGKFDMVFTDVKLQDVIERASGEIKSLADENSVSLVIAKTDIVLRADSTRLIQVMVNLMGNALKYSPAGGKLTVAVAEPAGWVEVRITDQGPGVPAQYKDMIFERYRQIPGSQKKGSTGLGLPICKLIVEQHGGEIGVNSQEGQGSTFWFRIPSGEEQS